ncbi:MAG: hypothetical protein NZ900_01200 [Synergistetes bacterium]|nr:hypothetical protein [Synergistota bacterium]MDW8191543.1 hypothetical protein [Synergistota bacterium]
MKKVVITLLPLFLFFSFPVYAVPYNVDIELLRRFNEGNLALEGFPWGSIDWEEKMVIVKGIGMVPEKYETEAQAKLLARRAAVLIAQRNALFLLYQLNYPLPKGYKSVKIKGVVGGGYVTEEIFDGKFYRIVLKIPLKELLEYSVEVQ